jgi:hypothetical protein
MNLLFLGHISVMALLYLCFIVNLSELPSQNSLLKLTFWLGLIVWFEALIVGLVGIRFMSQDRRMAAEYVFMLLAPSTCFWALFV